MLWCIYGMCVAWAAALAVTGTCGVEGNPAAGVAPPDALVALTSDIDQAMQAPVMT